MIENLMYEFYHSPTLYEKIAREAGDNFNLFNVLRLQSDEIAHSQVLGELLNPNGSHGQGDTFLKLFVDYLKIENFDTKTAKLYLEYHISSKTDTEGGRIDILIQDKNGVSIAIENKIWAGDQDAQLLRYYNFIKNNSNSRLFYLNLFGNEPTKESSQTLKKEDYQIISYEKDILNWLHLCREKAANLPILRESISQYINLIKSLTHQTNNAKMNNEIAESILASQEKLTAYLNLVENQAVKNAVYNQLLNKLKADLQKIADKKGLTLNTQRWPIFSFHNSQMDLLNVFIAYDSYSDTNIKNLEVGFNYVNKSLPNDQKIDLLRAKYKQAFGNFKKTEYSPCYKFHQHYSDWGKKEFEMIINGQMAELISEEVDKMLEIIDSIE